MNAVNDDPIISLVEDRIVYEEADFSIDLIVQDIDTKQFTNGLS